MLQVADELVQHPRLVRIGDRSVDPLDDRFKFN
jgi:hypothetical protein